MMKTKTAFGLAVGGALALTLAFAPTLANAQTTTTTVAVVTGSVLNHGGGRTHGLVAATVSVTGLTETDVRTALQSGQTLTQIAEANGKTEAAVIAAARTALTDRLSQSVTDGKLTQAEADAKLADFDATAPEQMNSTTLGQRGGRGDGGRGDGLGRGDGVRGGRAQSLIAATVSVTGLPEADVRTALQSGQTLTQIAEAEGKTAAAVIAAARETYATALSEAVAAGTLTQAQADARLAAFDAAAPGWMTTTLPTDRVRPDRHHGPDTQTDPTVPATPTTTAPTSSS